MIYLAEVVDGIVVRVIVGTQPEDGFVVIGVENTVGVGWYYVDGEFVAPEPEGIE